MTWVETAGTDFVAAVHLGRAAASATSSGGGRVKRADRAVADLAAGRVGCVVADLVTVRVGTAVADSAAPQEAVRVGSAVGYPAAPHVGSPSPTPAPLRAAVVA